MMKRIRSNCHIPHVLRSARPKLRIAIILNGEKELINSISECALNVLRGNVRLSECQKRKLHKHKAIIRKLGAKNVPLAARTHHRSAQRLFITPLGGVVRSDWTHVTSNVSNICRPTTAFRKKLISRTRNVKGRKNKRSSEG